MKSEMKLSRKSDAEQAVGYYQLAEYSKAIA